MQLNGYDFEKFVIQDPVHGSITFGSIERAAMDHKCFQRLHGLRQNSLLYLVFPAANHTRFDHSVGVMLLAEKFLFSILKNQKQIIEKGEKRSETQENFDVDGEDINFLVRSLEKENYFRIILRLAGLFHDIGHGPLRHLFDNFFPTKKWLENILKDDENYAHILDALKKKKTEENEIVRHEIISCILSTKILLDIKTELDEFQIPVKNIILDICSIIDKDIQPSTNITSSNFKYNLQPMLVNILSSDVDVDRMDYLLRDSQMCGVNYGLYEPNRILKSMCMYADLSKKEINVGIRYSALGAFEDFIHRRYQMHKQIYGHKTNRACSAMLEAIQDRLKDLNWGWYKKCSSTQELIDEFTELDDSNFKNQLFKFNENGEIKGREDVCQKVREISEMLFIKRKLYKKVFEEIGNDKDADDLKEKEQKHKKAQELLNKQDLTPYKEDTFKNKGPKFIKEKDKAPLKVLKKSLDGFYMVNDLIKHSSFLKTLPEVEKSLRIFCKENKRNEAKQLIKEKIYAQ